MEDTLLWQPDLVGRQDELGRLREALGKAMGGAGSTVLISGEAGIGKTRLVSEILSQAQKDGAAILRGWCLPDCLEPLMPVKEALRGADMLGLMEERPPPKVLSAYILNDSGMLYAKSERIKTSMDADIFAAMLNAVSSFVGDSLRMMGRGDGAGGLSTIGHSGYKILVQTRSRISLAAVIEGEENEFIIEEMNRNLAEIYPRLNPDIFNFTECEWLDEKISKFVNSVKYDGAFVQDDPRLRLENLFDNVLLGIQRLSLQSPVLLFLDDVHWSDPTTLSLFHYLSRNTRGNRVFMLATYRPEDVLRKPDGESHHLETTMQNMSRESLFSEVKLTRLERQDTERFITNALGKFEFGQGFAQRIHKESEGNPFFILELLRLMAAEKIIAKKEGIWSLTTPVDAIPIPSKVYDVIRRRINRLRKDELDMLECASVVGEKFGSEVVGISLGLNRISTLKALNSIEKEHRLIHSLGAGYCFDHSKVREVMYSGISSELRAEYHRIVAQSYGQMYAGRESDIAEELGHHYLLAGDRLAAKYLRMAGDRATLRYANDEAISFYSLTLGLAEEASQKAEILEKLGDLYTIVGQCVKAIAAYSDAVEIAKEPASKADLHRKMTLSYERHSEYEHGIAAAQAGLDILGEADDPVRCGLFTAMSLNYIRFGNYDKALEILLRAMMDATRLNEKKEIANTHRLMGITWWFRGDYDRALEHYQSALVIQREIGDDSGKENTLNNIGVVYMETGHLDEALEYFMEGLEYGEMVGDKSGTASTLDNIGNLHQAKGYPEKALEFQLRGLDLYRMSGDRNGIAWSLSSLGYVYQDLDQLDKSIEYHLESVEICKEIGDQHILTYDYYGLADSHRKCGYFEKATDYVNLALALSKELGARREEGASTYVLATIHRDMGKFSLAFETFALARKLLADVGDTTLQAMIDYDEGICLRMSGDLEGARKLLGKARDSFERMGLGTWLRKTKEALAEMERAC